MKKLVATFLFLLALPASLSAKGGVVTAADPRAADAGREILRQGGSASDAAIAMMLALSVVEPQSSGIGGGGFMIHNDGRTDKVETLDGRETAPASASPKLFLAEDGKSMPFLPSCIAQKRRRLAVGCAKN